MMMMMIEVVVAVDDSQDDDDELMSISMMMMMVMTFSGIMLNYYHAKVELLPFNERNEKRYTSDGYD